VVGAAGQHGFADRVGVHQVVALSQVAGQESARLRDPAAVRRFEAEHDPQQGGLAVAVAAHDPDPLPRGDAERDLGQQRPDAVRLGHELEIDEVRHRSPIFPARPAPAAWRV
jgi:hypothetical protein